MMKGGILATEAGAEGSRSSAANSGKLGKRRSNKKITASKKNVDVKKTAKDVVLDNSIQHLMKTNLLSYMQELSKDSSKFFEFFEDLPGSVRASLLTQFIPKVKDTDANLKESMLSLTHSFAHLPSVDDLTKRLKVLQLEINRLGVLLGEKEILFQHLSSVVESWVADIHKSFPTTAKDFNRRNSKCFFEVMLDQYDRLHEEYGEVIRRSKSFVLSKGEYEKRLVGGYEVGDENN